MVISVSETLLREPLCHTAYHPRREAFKERRPKSRPFLIRSCKLPQAQDPRSLDNNSSLTARSGKGGKLQPPALHEAGCQEQGPGACPGAQGWRSQAMSVPFRRSVSRTTTGGAVNSRLMSGFEGIHIDEVCMETTWVVPWIRGCCLHVLTSAFLPLCLGSL